MEKEKLVEDEDWWYYEPPATPYDLVGNNLITTFLRPTLYIAIRLYFKFHHKLKVSGYKVEYSKCSFIIVANHSSHLDTPLIFSCFPFSRVNKIRAIAALDYFFLNSIIRTLTHLFCNLIPINRKSADFIALSMCERVIQTDGSIIIYPEGSRTRTGKMGEFKPGVGILIKKTKAPVLPIFIKGTYECLNYKKLLPCSGPVEITFGTPLEYNNQVTDKMNYKGIADCIREAVIKTSEQFH